MSCNSTTSWSFTRHRPAGKIRSFPMCLLLLSGAGVLLASCGERSADEHTAAPPVQAQQAPVQTRDATVHTAQPSTPRQVAKPEPMPVPVPVHKQDAPDNMPQPVTLNLKLSDSSLERIHNQQTSQLTSAPEAEFNQQQGKKSRSDKISLKGAVLTDPEAEKIHQRIDGAKVNLELKWD